MTRANLPIIILLCALSVWSTIRAVNADEASDYLAAAGEQANAFGRCTIQRAWPLIKSQLSPDEIADRAVRDCGGKIPPIKAGLMGKPTNLSSEKADAVVSDIVNGNKTGVVKAVKQERAKVQ